MLKSRLLIVIGFLIGSTAYDAYGNVKEYNQNGRVYAYAYKNNAARDLESVTVEGITVAPEKDILGRNKGKEISANGSKLAGEYLYYRKVGDHATNMPSAVYFGQKQGEDFEIRDNVKYEYDKSGNICKIFENGALAVRYEYDSIDRLTREDNKKLGITTLFSYDNCGNITGKRQTAFTLKTNVEECKFTETLYSYDGDRLLSFGGEACEYDEIGNPAKYRGKEATWEKGRQMKSFDGNTFSYDGSGRRIGKNNIAYTYESNGRLIASSNGLEYLYDNNGVFGIKNNENLYIYRRDVQGNIVACWNAFVNFNGIEFQLAEFLVKNECELTEGLLYKFTSLQIDDTLKISLLSLAVKQGIIINLQAFKSYVQSINSEFAKLWSTSQKIIVDDNTETRAVIDYMRKNNLLSFASRKGKLYLTSA